MAKSCNTVLQTLEEKTGEKKNEAAFVYLLLTIFFITLVICFPLVMHFHRIGSVIICPTAKSLVILTKCMCLWLWSCRVQWYLPLSAVPRGLCVAFQKGVMSPSLYTSSSEADSQPVCLLTSLCEILERWWGDSIKNIQKGGEENLHISAGVLDIVIEEGHFSSKGVGEVNCTGAEAVFSVNLSAWHTVADHLVESEEAVPVIIIIFCVDTDSFWRQKCNPSKTAGIQICPAKLLQDTRLTF